MQFCTAALSSAVRCEYADDFTTFDLLCPARDTVRPSVFKTFDNSCATRSVLSLVSSNARTDAVCSSLSKCTNAVLFVPCSSARWILTAFTSRLLGSGVIGRVTTAFTISDVLTSFSRPSITRLVGRCLSLSCTLLMSASPGASNHSLGLMPGGAVTLGTGSVLRSTVIRRPCKGLPVSCLIAFSEFSGCFNVTKA